MQTLTGLDLLQREEFARLKGRSIGLLCNQASISRSCDHIFELLLPLHRRGALKIQAVFGPQHGLYGHTQDNMIEWEGQVDARTGLTIYSLYGEHREPSPKMLDGIEILVVDLADVGARYYTFIWTLALCMKACEPLGIQVMVLDRPNPIGGLQVEGTLLDPNFASFVGLYPLPSRHGMTIAEIAVHLQQTYFPKVDIDLVKLARWQRWYYFSDNRQPWGMPSPNMPTADSAVPYPGGCLLEATNISEGRGTTRPFEIIGAPYLDAWRFSDALNELDLPGVYFRPLQFEPTFNKHAKTLCGGFFLHVTDRSVFEPVIAHVVIIQEALRQAPEGFEWKQPPYEYEFEKMPIDILAGNAWLREDIENLCPLEQVRERFKDDCSRFEEQRNAALLY